MIKGSRWYIVIHMCYISIWIFMTSRMIKHSYNISLKENWRHPLYDIRISSWDWWYWHRIFVEYSKFIYCIGFNYVILKNVDYNVNKSLFWTTIKKMWLEMFTGKSREHKLTHMFLLERSGGTAENNFHQHIKWIMKLFKQHQIALDGDCIFIAIY